MDERNPPTIAELSWGDYLVGRGRSYVFSSDHKRFEVRRALPLDSKALCNVCLKTGLSGRDASSLYSNPTILGERWVLPYVELESQLAFVLVDLHSNLVCGYALGCLDTIRFEDGMRQKYLPKMQKRYPRPNSAEILIPTNAVAEEFYDFHNCPTVVLDQQYHSHLHIDILPEYQGLGLGRPLIAILFRALRNLGSKSVHLEMSGANDRASRFYRRLGFTELAVVEAATKKVIRSSNWQFLPNKPVSLDGNVIIYLGMRFHGEISPSTPPWNPFLKVRFGNNAIDEYFQPKSSLSKSNDSNGSCDTSFLICTAPEPWQLLESTFNRLQSSPQIRVHKHVIDSMDLTRLQHHADAYRLIHPPITSVVGLGGGSAADTAKFLADALSLPLVLIPSILSVDAAFTRAAGVRCKEGGKTSVRYVGDIAPLLDALLIDYQLLLRAPSELNRAGVGDILSIATGLWDWREAMMRQGERYSALIAGRARDCLFKLIASAADIASCSTSALQTLTEYTS
jgi:ribosomal protein S18 acetylase RimI-like enzyme